mmetsp:Transcript_7124/g.9311  ORF Transcript_7124/g.9311 Transcript_7124/m.9311 type:complete len:89 (-) Transcript_7124:633-899(-)
MITWPVKRRQSPFYNLLPVPATVHNVHNCNRSQGRTMQDVVNHIYVGIFRVYFSRGDQTADIPTWMIQVHTPVTMLDGGVQSKGIIFQ